MKWINGLLAGLAIVLAVNHIAYTNFIYDIDSPTYGYAICFSVPLGLIAGLIGWPISTWLFGKRKLDFSVHLLITMILVFIAAYFWQYNFFNPTTYKVY